jgi:hypothetical protein
MDLKQVWVSSTGAWSITFSCPSGAIRVTRFGEFSPLGRLYTLGHFFKTSLSSQNFGDTLFPRKSFVVKLTKYSLGFILGDSFTDTSGHAVGVVKSSTLALLTQFSGGISKKIFHYLSKELSDNAQSGFDLKTH